MCGNEKMVMDEVLTQYHSSNSKLSGKVVGKLKLGVSLCLGAKTNKMQNEMDGDEAEKD